MSTSHPRSASSPAPISDVLAETLVCEEIAARGRPLSGAELIDGLRPLIDAESVCRALGRLLDRGDVSGETHSIPFSQCEIVRFKLTTVGLTVRPGVKGLFDDE